MSLKGELWAGLGNGLLYFIQLSLNFLQGFHEFPLQGGIVARFGLGGIPDKHHGDIILHVFTGEL